ncbi:MAG: DMT family transporter [Oscillatoria sp. PMC 1068.18]|nr:DMT family transporter [Oscillatoria sp. PMC 1076.18]MEC4991560.1 DMT family transporter [Oscillatoria sp. PMC 1068.18]
MIFSKQIFKEDQTNSGSNTLAFTTLIIALIALSITAILIRICLEESSPNTIVFDRLWVATLCFGLWNGFSQLRIQISNQSSEPEKESPKSESIYDLGNIFLLVIVGISHLSGRLLWTISLGETSVANANVLGALTPLFVTLGAWLFLKQRFDGRFLFGLFLAIVGTATLAYEDFFKSNSSFLGDSIALSSALFYSINFLTLEKLRNKFSVEKILLWRCFLGAILMLPVVLIFEDQYFPISLTGWLTIICLAVICEVVGHGLVVYSLKHFSSSFVSLVLLLDPIVAAILAWILFAENLSLFNILGFAVIMQGIYLAKTGQGSQKSNDTETTEETISETA